MQVSRSLVNQVVIIQIPSNNKAGYVIGSNGIQTVPVFLTSTDTKIAVGDKFNVYKQNETYFLSNKVEVR